MEEKNNKQEQPSQTVGQKVDQAISEVAKECAALRNGNTHLLEVMMELLRQHCLAQTSDGGNSVQICTDSISANERALDILVVAGLAREEGGDTYILDFRALLERKQEFG